VRLCTGRGNEMLKKLTAATYNPCPRAPSNQEWLMKKSSFIFTGLALSSLVFAAERLNVKTGLWEITASTVTQGVPPIPAEVLSKMTAEQRAQLEGVFGSGEGKPHTHTSKECVTEEDLAQPFSANGDKNCVSTVVKSTSTSQEVDVSCRGEIGGKGKLRINTPTPESMTGDFEIQAGGGGEAMTIRTQLKGRWLSGSCKGTTG
jgi:hypothetical protein